MGKTIEAACAPWSIRLFCSPFVLVKEIGQNGKPF